jgi:uncharacterized protein YegJ (DUF2314 family)
MRAFVIGFALAALAACGQPAQQDEAGDTQSVDTVAAEDPAVSAAIAEARASLPRFWELYTAQDAEAFWLKAGFPTANGGTEHIWLDQIASTPEGVISGRVQNEPQNVPSLQMGARTTITEDMISDWSLQRGGRTYGHFTTRALVAGMPPEQQAEYADFVSGLAPGAP